MTLDVDASRLTIRGFAKPDAAASAYAAMEPETSSADIDVVLVSVSSINNLRSAYPNYFLDTTRFVSLLQSAIQ